MEKPSTGEGNQKPIGEVIMNTSLPPFIDLHEDISLYYVSGGAGLKFTTADFSYDMPGRDADIPKYTKANVKIVLGSIAPLTYTLSSFRESVLTEGYKAKYRGIRTRSAQSQALQHFLTYYELERKYTGNIEIVRSLDDIEKLWLGNKTGILISMEGTESLEDIEDLYLFWELGLRSLQLTWNFDNRYAASCFSKKDYGLTGEGEQLIEIANDLGIILDLAHSSEKSAKEAVGISSKPVIISHTNAKAVKDHVRNVSDEVIEAVSAKGGVIGFSCISPTIPGNSDLDGLISHIMHVYDSFGPRVIGIGTDYFGLLDLEPTKGLENITKLPDLWNALLEHGMSEKDIDLITHENALRVFRANMNVKGLVQT